MFGGLQLYCNEQNVRGTSIRVLEYSKKHTEICSITLLCGGLGL